MKLCTQAWVVSMYYYRGRQKKTKPPQTAKLLKSRFWNNSRPQPAGAKNKLPFFVWTTCNRNLWLDENLFETKTKTTNTGAGSPAGPQGSPSVSGWLFRSYTPPFTFGLLSAIWLGCQSVTQQLPWEDPTFRYPQSLPKIIAKDSSVR